jgi:Fe-S cluster biosynthesis and repair protein YggX
MQIISIILAILPATGLVLLLEKFGQTKEFIAFYTQVVGNIYSIIVATYNTWQTIYVMNLLFLNIKRLNEFQNEHRQELKQIETFNAQSNLPRQDDKTTSSGEEQTVLTRKIIISSIIGFAFLGGVVLALFYADTVDSDGKLTLTGSWAAQSYFIFGTLT